MAVIRKQKHVIMENVQWIVSGLHGVNGPHVLRSVEKDYKKERGLKPQMPKMVERNVLAVIRKQNHVIMEIVKWIVSGLLGVNGPHVLINMEMGNKKEGELKSQMPRMVERHVVERTRKQNHAIFVIVTGLVLKLELAQQMEHVPAKLDMLESIALVVPINGISLVIHAYVLELDVYVDTDVEDPHTIRIVIDL